MGGIVTSDKGDAVFVRGVVWGTQENPTIESKKTIDGSGTGSFVSHLEELEPGSLYYVRAYAANSNGIAYGNSISFQTPSFDIPVLTTAGVSGITHHSATCGGTITLDGGNQVIFRGVVWGTHENPTIEDNKTIDGSGMGSFVSHLDGLEPATVYYVRAYAVNSKGIAYGNSVTFQTLAFVIPVVTTAEVSGITNNSATCGGTVTSDGGNAVITRGVVWGIHENPTTEDFKTVDGSGMGSFVSQLDGLEPATVYYVRAYAVNSNGTAYGNAVTFQTLTSDVPVVSTAEVSAITNNTAICGGTVTSDGGNEVIARGVVWGTHENPTTGDYKTVDGSGTGSFVSQLDGLDPETVYYVRAYATNSQGTAYGNTLTFQTLSGQEIGTFTDSRDGTVYKTIKIGNQDWMAENLRYLPSMVGPENMSDTEPYYYVYDYHGTNVEAAKATTIYAVFGALYNWPAAMNGESSSGGNPSGVQGICPANWHLPSDAEWAQLIEYLGGENVAGGKMKDNTDLYWISPNVGATNESGFTALPAGYLYYDHNFHHLGYYATWWSATVGFVGAYDRFINNDSGRIHRSESGRSGGWSVRCVKN